jgi:hypothetical protein
MQKLNTKKTDKVTKVINTKKAILSVKDGLTGKQLSKLITTKIESNKQNKAELGTLSFNLAQFKKHAANFVTELNKKNETKVTIDEIINIKPSQFVSFLTEKEKERLTKNGNLFTFWLVESLVSRYFNSLKK